MSWASSNVKLKKKVAASTRVKRRNLPLINGRRKPNGKNPMIKNADRTKILSVAKYCSFLDGDVKKGCSNSPSFWTKRPVFLAILSKLSILSDKVLEFGCEFVQINTFFGQKPLNLPEVCPKNPRSRQNRRESPNFIRTTLFEGTNTDIQKDSKNARNWNILKNDCLTCPNGRKAV